MDPAFLDSIKEEAIKKAYFAQPWKDYFTLRKEELAAISRQVDIGHKDKMLDIGSGNAFTPALFSKNVNFVVASDLFSKQGIHSSMYNFERAKMVIEKLNINNCKILSSRAENLPFKNNIFDLIYCQFVLQYLNEREKEKAMREIARILKKNGIAIIVVPNFTQAIFSPLCFYIEIARKLYRYAAKKILSVLFKKNNGNSTGYQISPHRYKNFKEFKVKHPHFPFPEPCGNYKNISDQLFKETPYRWKKIILKNNLFITKTFSPVPFPFWQPLGIVAPDLRLKMYIKCIRIISFLNLIPPLKFFGDSLCFVVQNNKN